MTGRIKGVLDPFFAAGRGSLTFWWGMATGAVLGAVAGLAEYVNEQSIAEGIRQYLSRHPEWVAVLLLRSA